MYNNMAGCQRRHKPIKLATYCNHKIIFNINILTKKHHKHKKTEIVQEPLSLRSPSTVLLTACHQPLEQFVPGRCGCNIS